MVFPSSFNEGNLDVNAAKSLATDTLADNKASSALL